MKFLFLILFPVLSLANFESFPKEIKKDTPIFFTLHGCKQDAKIFLEDTFLLKRAKDKAVFYSPSQSVFFNVDRCWNWFMPVNQLRVPLSETSNMMSKFNHFKKKNGLTHNPVYLIGISAGGAQIMNLLACYPKEFSGAAVSAGLPYRVTDLIYDINDVIAYGPKKSSHDLIKDFSTCSKKNEYFENKKYLFIHGHDDLRVSMKNFAALRAQFISSFDYRDDKKLNNSVKEKIFVNRFEEVNKYPYEHVKYVIQENTEAHFYYVHGLRHDWSGGEYRVERNDPLGPDATGLVLKYFLDI